MTEMTHKLFSSSFYLFENTFGGVPISTSNMLKSEVFLEECSLQPRGTIDEKYGVGDVVFLLEFLQELFRHGDGSRRKQPHVQEFVRSGIDSGVQPKSLIVELNHGFVDRNVIRALPVDWLHIGLLHSVVNGRACALDTEVIEETNSIRKR
jgi:hypothetical protein